MSAQNRRGRKKLPPKPQSNKIFGYLQEPKADTVVQSILDELIATAIHVTDPGKIASDIVDSIIDNMVLPEKTKVKKHSGVLVSNETKFDWQQKYPWLVITEESPDNIRLKCRTCTTLKQQCKLTSVWAYDGSPNIQISSIVRHNDSIEHKSASSYIEQKKQEEYFAEDVEEDLSSCSISKNDKILFNTAYFCAKQDIPNSQINELLNLQRLNGLDIAYQNVSWDTVTEVQAAISHVLTRNIVEEVRSSPIFALMLDENTDITVEKRLSVCIRYVKAGEAVTTFLCNVPLEDGRAHTIVNCVVHELKNLNIPLEKCTSLATDGASVMVGKHTGVGKQLHGKYSPFCVQTHCIAHRLNLACTDCIKKNDFMIKFKEKFSSLYFFVSGSSVRTLTLKNIQRLLEEPEITIKEPHSIRWLGLKNAVEAVFESYGSVLAMLSKFAAEKNAVAKGLYKYFSNYKVALVVAFMLDIHTELAVLSCQMQRQNLLFSEIQPMLDGTLSKIEHLQHEDGDALKTMKGNLRVTDDGEAYYREEKVTFNSSMSEEFRNIRQDYVTRMKKNIKARFRKEDSAIFSDLSKVFEPQTLNSVSDSEAEEAVEHLGTLYGYSKQVKVVEGNLEEGTHEEVRTIPPLLDAAKLKAEWPRLKGMVKGAYSNLDTSVLCKRLILLHSNIMPNSAILASVALCMQVTSVECERSFSAQNRLKNKFRASLGPEKLEMLMRIHLLGPEQVSTPVSKGDKREENRRLLYDRVITSAIAHWEAVKKRRKRRLSTEYKPRSSKKAKLL